MSVSDFPDFGALSQQAKLIAALQVTAQEIAQALQSTGVPPSVAALLSAEVTLGGISGSPHTLVTFGANAVLWHAQLSLHSGYAGSYSGGLQPLYSALKLSSGKTLAIVEGVVGGSLPGGGMVAASNPLYGLAVNAGDSVQLDVNGGTDPGSGSSIRASGLLLYQSTQPVPSGSKALVGAYIKPSAWGSGTSISTAESNWSSITSRVVNVRRVYWSADNTTNAMPTSITGPGTGQGSGQLGDVSAGIKNCISLSPAFNPVSATDLANIDAYLSSCKAAGLTADVCLWHEPYANMTAAQFIAMFQYYAPTVRKYYPAVFCTSSYAAQVNNSAVNYFPGTGYVDKLATDFYAGEYFDTQAIRLDATANVADTYSLPFGIWEFNGSTDHQTDAQLDTFFSYVQTFMSDRVTAGKINADILLFNDDQTQESPYILSSSDYRVPKYQAIYDALSAVG